jgi:hypothetical protein
MILLGYFHIIILLACYVAFLFITIRSFSGKTPFRFLMITNIAYLIGFVIGIIWSKIAWGFYLNADIKTVLSIIILVPFILENILKTKKFYLPLAGTIIIVLNYVLPQLIGTVHTG